METKVILCKAKMEWHTRRRNYYYLLQEGCLDAVMKAKLQRKIDYHTDKLKEYA